MNAKRLLRWMDEFFKRKDSEHEIVSTSRVRTVSNGTIHVSASFHTVDTEDAAASDDVVVATHATRIPDSPLGIVYLVRTEEGAGAERSLDIEYVTVSVE